MSHYFSKFGGPFRRPRNKIFSIEGILKCWEITPIVGLVVLACNFYVVTATYMIATREYVTDYHRKALHQRMNLLKPYPMKVLTIDQEYPPMPYLYSLLKCMGDAEKKIRERQRYGCQDQPYQINHDMSIIPWTKIESDNKIGVFPCKQEEEGPS